MPLDHLRRRAACVRGDCIEIGPCSPP
jgi:hypothetical protein